MLQKNIENNFWAAGQIYHYEIKNNYDLTGNDFHSITLKYCTISECHFLNTLLADSDWDSCRVENCTFQSLSLENGDITSTYFENCLFDNVSFKGATATDITFSNCSFINCNFNHISLSTSMFKKCQFTKLRLRQSSTTLNQFDNCIFIDSKIEGNFLYNLLLNSTFKQSRISKSVLSSNYGFTSPNLEELALNKIDFTALQQDLLDKKDFIGAAIISINIDQKFRDYSIWASIQVVINQLRNNILVRVEQIHFFKLILEYMLMTRSISLYTVVVILDSLEKIKSIETNIAIKKAESAIQQMQGILLENYYEMINHLHEKLQDINIEDNPIQLKITYEAEPAVPICSLLGQLMNSMNIPGSYPLRTKTETGSFIEWIQGYDNIIKCLQLIVSILGLGLNIIRGKGKSRESMPPKPNRLNEAPEKLSRDSQQNIFQDDILDKLCSSADLGIPQSVLTKLNSASTEKDVHQTINVFVLNNITINNNFQGYNSLNVKRIEVL